MHPVFLCQIAAGTLDASAKIYAVRVDVVHADTYKVLGGLGKGSTPTEDTDSPKGGVPFTHFLLSCSWFNLQVRNVSVLNAAPINFEALSLRF